ncbi:hypothetical protein ACF8C4_05415 [Myroides odoratimimus]|uniref:hypothetical protein n=1 Tax=Myroides odoratimimus TaxID=76832 RepID=UPI003709CBAC
MISRNALKSLASIVGVFFLFLAMNPFLLWIVWPVLINIPMFLVLISLFLVLIRFDETVISYSRVILAFLALLFLIHLGTPFLGNPGWEIGKISSFLGFICLIFFSDKIIFQIFLKFRYLLKIISWFALVVFIITAVGVELPYYKIPAFTLVMENSFKGEAFYKLYGLVVSSTNTVYSFGGMNIARICGPVQEPGHFAIYLGVLVFFEKIIFNKISKIFIIVGILTFSPNFLIILFISFLNDLFTKKGFNNSLKYIIGAVVLFISLLISSEEVREEVMYLVVGRNFGEGIMGVSDVLDNRAGKVALSFYNRFSGTYEIWYGKGIDNLQQFGVLSDYRGMIFKFGIIGLVLSFLMVFNIVSNINNKLYKFLLSLIILIIYLQRSWMFESTFIYAFLVIGIVCLNNRSFFNLSTYEK